MGTSQKSQVSAWSGKNTIHGLTICQVFKDSEMFSFIVMIIIVQHTQKKVRVHELFS